MASFKEITFPEAEDWTAEKNESVVSFRVVLSINTDEVISHSFNTDTLLGRKNLKARDLNSYIPIFYSHLVTHSFKSFHTYLKDTSTIAHPSAIVYEIHYPVKTRLSVPNAESPLSLFMQKSSLAYLIIKSEKFLVAMTEYRFERSYSFETAMPVHCLFSLSAQNEEKVPDRYAIDIHLNYLAQLEYDESFLFQKEDLDYCKALSLEPKKNNRQIALELGPDRNPEEMYNEITYRNKKIVRLAKKNIAPVLTNARYLASYLKSIGLVG